MKSIIAVCMCVFGLGLGASAQKPVRSAPGSGTPGAVPVFLDDQTIGNSDISDQQGKVSVTGEVSVSGSVSGSVGNFSGDSSNPFLAPNMVLGVGGVFIGDNGGVIGWDKHVDAPGEEPTFHAGVIGKIDNTEGSGLSGFANATSGNARGVRGQSFSPDGVGVLAVAGPDLTGEGPLPDGTAIGVLGRATTMRGTGVRGRALAATGSNVGVQGISDSSQGTGVLGIVDSNDATAYAFAVRGSVNATNGVAGQFEVTNPQSWILRGYAGGQAVFSVNSAGIVHSGPGADIAEHIDALEKLSAGDVVEIDPTHEGQFRKVSSAHSSLVAGVISTMPGVEMGNSTSASGTGDERPLLALAGRVPVKVTAEAGAIRIGDLLTSSSRPGYAMRCASRVTCSGEILGKALQPLASGSGTIQALLTLQ